MFANTIETEKDRGNFVDRRAGRVTVKAHRARPGACSPAKRAGRCATSPSTSTGSRPGLRPGLPDTFRFHDLRHTANTLTAAAGASTAELMARMGHASHQAALRYQHATKDRDAALARALDGFVAESRPERLHVVGDAGA